MKYIKQEECYLIRLYKDEDLFSALEEFAVAEELSAGMLKGIGALKEVELGFYHLETKTYDRKEFNGDFELLRTSLVKVDIYLEQRLQLLLKFISFQ